MRKKSNIKDLNLLKKGFKPTTSHYEAFILSLCYNSCIRKYIQSEDTVIDQGCFDFAQWLQTQKRQTDFFEEFRANTCGPN